MDKLSKKRMIAIAKDTVKNPAKALLGGPSLSEAKKILKKSGVRKKMSGGIMKASAGKMTEADLQKKVDRDARINKARKSIKKQKEKDQFETSPSQRQMQRRIEMQRRIGDRGREMRRIGKAMGRAKLGPIGAMPTKELKQRMQGMSKGGMCRGMGAAIRGGDFKGVK